MKREVAVGIAATFLFFFSALLIPVAGFVMGIFTPLPTVLLYYRWGRPLGYLVPGAALLGGTLLLSYFGMAPALPYFIQFLLMGIVLGIGMRRAWSVEKAVVVPSLILYVMGALTLWMSIGGTGDGIFSSLEKELHEAVVTAFQHYGPTSPEKQMLQEMFEQAIPTMVLLLPGTSLSFALLVSWLNLLAARRYCRIHGLPLPLWVEWAKWKAPDHLVWPVIVCGFLLLLQGGPVWVLAINSLIVLGTIYFFQGLAIMTFYFDRWKVPRLFRAILYGLLLLQQFAGIGAILLGLFDIWFDFRRLSPNITGNS